MKSFAQKINFQRNYIADDDEIFIGVLSESEWFSVID
jgi:hypothetical protein